MIRHAWLLAGLVVLGGCLFRSPEAPRFFRPASAILDAAPGDNASPPATGSIAIRIRGVRSEPFLRERVVWRVSEVEYGLYEQRRWIDLPEHYVERALRARLRTTPGLRLTNDVRAVALRVVVLAFDDVLAPSHAADVTLNVAVDDPVRGRVFMRTFDARVGIEDGDPAAMAKAMGQALDEAVAQVADAVRAVSSTQGKGAGGRRQPARAEPLGHPALP